MSWRSTAVVGVLLLTSAAAVVVAGGQHPELAVSSAQARSVPVTSATLSCPASPRAPGSLARVLAVTPVSGDPSAAPSARLRIVNDPPAGAQLSATSIVGVPLTATLGALPTTRTALVTGSGPLVAGAAAFQVSTFGSPRTSGVAMAHCAAAQAQWWFSGVDTGVGTTTHLELSNPGAGISVVDVSILGPGGPIAAPGGQGVAMAPRSRTTLDLAGLAPGRAALTLHVTATRGTVAAAVSTTRLDGLTPTGAEWVPPSPAPSTTVVVNSGVAGATRQQLVVTNPGLRQQLVAVRVLDASGAFVPSGLPDLQVPPGAVVVRDVTALTREPGSAVELSAAAPVTGALVSEVSGRGDATAERDFAVSGVSDTLSGPAVVPLITGSQLTITTTATTAAPRTVRIETYGNDGSRLAVAILVVAGSATTSWTMPATPGASYVVVSPSGGGGTGLVQAGATFTGPGGATQVPVLSGRTTVREPAVLAAVPAPGSED